MKKKNNKKGFTLAELLIVVTISAVLVAIAIPVFTTQLEKSREATALAIIRSAYAEASVRVLDKSDGTDGSAASAVIKQQSDRKYVDNHIAGVTDGIPSVKAGDTVTVPVSGTDGTVTFKFN